ncbi:hypothetical protein HPB49_017783 [Dermacentor silvarum]|uniref:Uncharacterized protein n=1 Tax=Dermacentor silvarum TaxID=543639 RepID=A0ACB8E215_DERSI|nr:hypothetical protein HPB49_017783 [Dermacentor silvarum]
MIAIDFKGAFDSVWHLLVLSFMKRHACPRTILDLLRSLLTDRSVVYRSHSGEVSAEPTLGSPQGSPISPLLWNVVVRGLLHL